MVRIVKRHTFLSFLLGVNLSGRSYRQLQVQRLSVSMSNITQPMETWGCGGSAEREATDCGSIEVTDPPSRAMIEAHKLDSTASCSVVRNVFKLEGRATGTQESSTTVTYRGVRNSFQVLVFGIPRHMPAVLTTVDMAAGHVGVLMVTLVTGKLP